LAYEVPDGLLLDLWEWSLGHTSVAAEASLRVAVQRHLQLVEVRLKDGVLLSEAKRQAIASDGD
jgi:hypothetical protein